MIFKISGYILFLLLLQLILTLTACGESSKDSTPDNRSSDAHGSSVINWGEEVNLDEMIAMAKEGKIKEIQWHVLPNILRAETGDGKFFHLKNENKGVDLRNTLIKSGVRIGDGGIEFKHLF
ncbi:MAG: hypothetical protein GX654_00385 [Desulfatiglans sp.]|jgi:hypothetical protein|nr:hypothetical protein [Desulfatiglans sp.]